MRMVSEITARLRLPLVLVDEVQAREQARDDGEQQQDDDDLHGEAGGTRDCCALAATGSREDRPSPSRRAWSHGGGVRMSRSRCGSGRWQADRGRREGRAPGAARGAHARGRRCGSPGAVASAEALLYRRVRAAGDWIAAAPDLHRQPDPRRARGLRRDDAAAPRGRRSAVLVNRGWVARGRRLSRGRRRCRCPPGPVEVSGLATLPPRALPRAVGRHRSPATCGRTSRSSAIASRTRHARCCRSWSSPTPPAPGLAARREKPDAGIAKHREYALTWFSLAATALVLWIALNLRRVR